MLEELFDGDYKANKERLLSVSSIFVFQTIEKLKKKRVFVQPSRKSSSKNTKKKRNNNNNNEGERVVPVDELRQFGK
jgi:hypothetical protein